MQRQRVSFDYAAECGDELANTAIQITCYDRTGKEVKRVTSTSGEVEDPEEENQNQGGESGNQNQGGNTGGNTGGGGYISDED